MNKTKITRSQLEAINKVLHLLKTKQAIIDNHLIAVKTDEKWGGEFGVLNELSFDDMCAYLYGEYEIIQEDQYILVTSSMKSSIVRKIEFIKASLPDAKDPAKHVIDVVDILGIEL